MKRVSILTLSILALLISVPQVVGANQAPAVLPPTTTVAITEMMAGGAGGYDDSLEIQNVSSSTVNVDGWKVVVSNSYTTWEASTTEQTLSGNMAPGETKTWNDLAGSTNYWGTNIYWVETTTGKGWILLLDSNNEVVDFVCTGWTATEVATGSITCSAGTYDVSVMWTGDGHPNLSETETQSWQRVGSSDTDTNADWKTQYFRLWTGDGHVGGAAVTDSYQRIASTDSDSSADWATQAATNGVTNTGLTSTAGVMITEVDGDTASGYDFLEIQNTGFNSADVTGWTVIISDSYTDWTANSIEHTLTGSIAVDGILSFTDDTSSTTATYWGNNMYWSDLVGSGNLPNWTLLLDETGAVVDFYCTEWTAAEMTNAVIETNSLGSYPIVSMGNTNHGLILPFGGGTTPTTPTVSWTTASQNSVSESGTMTLTAELSAVSNSAVTFLIFVDPTSTATSPSDYTISPSGISIPAGQLSGSVTITIADDTVVEADETVIVTMGTPINATLGSIATHTATITDDDSTTPPTNTQLQTTFAGGNGYASNYFQVDVASTNGITVTSMSGNFTAAGTVEVWARDGLIGTVPGSTGWSQVATASLTAGGQQSFTTNFSLAAGSHTLFFSNSTDLAYTNGTAVGAIAAQDTNLTIYEGYGSADYQPDGTSGYAFSPRIWNGIIEYTTGGGTTPTTPTVSWTTSSQTSVAESGTLTVTAELSATSNSDVSFDVGVGTSSTASNPADYTLSSTSLQIPAGQLTADLTITIVDDATAESDETIILTMGTPVNATLGTPNNHTATITDDDSTTPPTGNQVQTTFAGGNGFASNYFQVDVVPASGITVTSMSGNFSAAGTVEVWARAGVVGTVPGSTGWSQVATSSIAASGQQSFTTNFSLSAGSHTLFFSNSTNIAYTNGTAVGAIAGQDANLIIYEGHGSADFQPDGTSGYAFTPRVWNGIIEYTVGGGGTTTSNISINDMSLAEGNSGTSLMDFTVTLSPAATSTVTVDYATSDDTATISNADYVAIPSTTLIFNVGETTKTISVMIYGDILTEADETFQVNLSNAIGGSIQDSLGVGTITNDDTTGTNTAPVIPTMTGTNNPMQVKSDGVTEIMLTESISDVTAIFKAFVTDGQSNNVKIQVEVRKVDEAFPSTFTASDSLSGESIFAAPYDAINNPTQPAMEVVISPLADGDYQWRIRPVDDLGLVGTWVYYGGNSNGTPPTQSADIDFTVDTTGGSGGSSYPSASGSLGTGHISSVQIQDLTGADLLISDSGDSGYTDFTTTPGLDVQLRPGQTYTLNVDAANTVAQYVCWAWIDWNSNVDFSDESPLLLMDMTGNGDLFSTTFTVPANAVPGETRLRLRLWDGSLTLDGDPAGTFSTGEVEDYKVTVPGAVNPAPVVNGGSSGNCGGSIAGSQNGTLLMSLLGFVAIFLLVGIRREA